MIKSNWDIFKAKFSDNPQDYFEWFCYLLFCKEFDKPLGVAGYKNHRHLEHDPIVKGKEVIGWQGKFYDTKLTEHKADIIKFIKGSKKDYPNITKIIFYTNKNWSQGTKVNDPQIKIEIDAVATDLGVTIDWEHMANFFDSPFVAIDNENIAKDFFSLEINGNIDPRDVEQYLKKLPLKIGKEATKNQINIMYQEKEITLEEKELLLITISQLFNHNQSLIDEIDRLRDEGQYKSVEFLEIIQKYYIDKNPTKIKETYFLKKEEFKQSNILNIKESIKATQLLYAIEETKELYEELMILEPSADNYSEFAYFLKKFNYLDDAIGYFQNLLDSYKKLAKEDPNFYLPVVAGTLNDFATLYSRNNNFPKALEKYSKALKIYRELTDKNEDSYLPIIASIIGNQANVYAINKEFPQAYEKFRKAISIYDKLIKKDPNSYLALLATLLNNLSNLQKENNQLKPALQNGKSALKIRRELAKDNPNTYLPDVATTLENLANAQLADKNFDDALVNYVETLKIRRKFAEKNKRTYKPLTAQTLSNLGSFYAQIGDFSKAFEMFDEALIIRRGFALETPQLYLPLVVKILINIEKVYLRMENFSNAIKIHDEIYSIYMELANEEPEIYKFKCAEILVYGVYYYLHCLNNKNDLNKAKNILVKYSSSVQKRELLQWISELESI